MGIEKENMKLSAKSMEEIEVFKTADSPTGERIKLFVDELEPFDGSGDVGPLDMPQGLPLAMCGGQGHDFDLDYMIDLELGSDLDIW